MEVRWNRGGQMVGWLMTWYEIKKMLQPMLRNSFVTVLVWPPNRNISADSRFQQNNADLYFEKIEKLNKNYDFIFIDAAKGQYKKFFEDSYKLLNKGGLVFIDNILFRGYLYKESPKRFKTIVKRLDEFIEYLYENFEDVTLLPISDGVMLVNKN